MKAIRAISVRRRTRSKLLRRRTLFSRSIRGAIYRGSRLSPYPSAVLLGRIAELGGRVILASDAHCTDAVAYKFDEAAEYAAAAGIKNIEKYPPKFVPVK